MCHRLYFRGQNNIFFETIKHLLKIEKIVVHGELVLLQYFFIKLIFKANVISYNILLDLCEEFYFHNSI